MRLEALGFSDVFDYAGGKRDWLAEGMPVEGDRADEIRLGSLARDDPPNCRPGDSIGAVAGRDDVERWGLCVVSDDDGTVHGLLTHATLSSAGTERVVDQVMVLGPRTVRPDASPQKTLDRMERDSLDSILVTTSRGRLLGVLFPRDLRHHVESSGGE